MSANFNAPFSHSDNANDGSRGEKSLDGNLQRRSARLSGESLSHRNQRADFRAGQRLTQGSEKPPSAHVRNPSRKEYGSDAGQSDTTGRSDPEKAKKRVEYANQPTEHIERNSPTMSEDSYGDGQRLPSSPKPNNSHFRHGYGDLERGLGPGHTRDLHQSMSRSSTKPLTLEEEEAYRYAEPNRAVRPQMFGRTFTQQIRTAGQEDDGDIRDSRKEDERLPLRYIIDTHLKNHMVAALGEFIGTTMFLFFAFTGTGVANIPTGTGSNSTTTGATGFNISVQTYVALSFGFSLMVNAWVFYRISGGLFNPAVTLALVLIRAITPTRGVFVLAAQAAGGIAAAGLASCLFPTPLNVSTSLAPGVSLVQGVFIEAILTFELVFTIFMLAAEKHRATFVAPVGIGLALFIAELGGVYYTGGSLNPARSLGPCVIAAKFETEHWIYWVGPFIGTLVAVGFYKIFKFLQYETVNPGQDSHE